MTFTSRDQYLSIQGAREAYSEIRGAYESLGKQENVQFVEDDYKHWMTPRIRTAIYTFFMKHLGVSGDPAEEEVEILPQEELVVTPTGQVSTYLKGESVFSMNLKETEILIRDLEESRTNIDAHLDRVRMKAKELSGYIEPGPDRIVPFFNGRYQRDGYTVSRIAIPGEGDYAIPILFFVPDDAREKLPALVYLHPDGKVKEAGAGGEIEKLVKKGYIVAAVDVIGVGEVDNTIARAYTDDYNAILLGRSTVGVQAGDINRVVHYLKQLDRIDATKIGAIGLEGICIPLMHAAAFNPSITQVALIRAPISYRSIVMNRFYKIGLIAREGGGYWHPYEIEFPWGVAGALTAYDLPDLIGCIAPRKVAFIAPQNQLLEPASDELIKTEMKFPVEVYNNRQNLKNLMISSSDNLPSIVDWLFE
jgi:hypothetical protein